MQSIHSWTTSFVHKEGKCFSRKVESGVEELRFWGRFWKIMRTLKTTYGLRYCTILLYPAGILSCLTAATRKGKVNNQIDVLTIRQLNNFSVLHTKDSEVEIETSDSFAVNFITNSYFLDINFTTAILGFLSYLKLDDKPSWTMLRVSEKCMLALFSPPDRGAELKPVF